MLTLTGSLSDIVTIYTGPTQGGVEQVVVSLRTHDSDGEGVGRWAVNIDPGTTPMRRASIAHELALGLLAHELLEQMAIDGVRAFDPHADGQETAPPLLAHSYAEGHLGVTLCKSADQSHTGEQRWCDAPIEPGVAEIVRRLNHPVFGSPCFTVASCDGHGVSGVSVTLSSGETISASQGQ